MYKQAYEILSNYDPSLDIEIRLRVIDGQDQRCFNLSTASKVALILPGNPLTAPCDIILRSRQGYLQHISELHSAYLPLQYPLLFPFGENGWYPELQLLETVRQQGTRIQARQDCWQHHEERGIEVDDDDATLSGSRQLTLMRYAAYQIHFRPGQFNGLLHGGCLFSHLVVDLFASIDHQRLCFIELNQTQFWAARFNNLEDAAADDPDGLDLNDIGQRIFLPSSYIGGPRNMHQCFQDAMAVARYFQKVDLFITMTTNPNWPEIQREHLPGQTAYDRPDLVARVFCMKLDHLLKLITKHGIFGTSAAHVYTIEFQKRGLPLVHLLIFLKDPHKLLSPEAVDSCIWAQWPDPETQPLLFETVKTCMVHGPCGPDNPTGVCMVDNKCSKGFPKPFSEATTMDHSGYPKYFRPDNGRAYEVSGRLTDNHWLVPFNPFLSAKLNCHVNVECAASILSIKYAFQICLQRSRSCLC